MSAETVLFATLDAAAAVGALCANRIYPDTRAQESVLPAIVYRRDDTEFVATIHGTIALTRARLSVVALADTRAAAEALADAVYTAVLAAGFLMINRASDFDVDSRTYVATLAIEHLS